MSLVILRMCGKGRRAVNMFQEWGYKLEYRHSDSLESSKFFSFSLHPPVGDDPQCNLRILIKELSRLICKYGTAI